MGLMLGASVMTVCELVDLIFYNGCLKLISRKRVARKNSNRIQHNDLTEEKLDCKEVGNGNV